MEVTFIVGILGSIVLVMGAAWPATKAKHHSQSAKNWLFASGSTIMLVYSLLNYYLVDGDVFFIFLQCFIVVSSVLMMVDADDRLYVPIMSGIGAVFVLWSLFLFEGVLTAAFVLGLVLIGVGYVLKNGTARRNAALFAGSALIAVFSYFVGNLVFLWLNVFFAIFSGYYTLKLWRRSIA